MNKSLEVERINSILNRYDISESVIAPKFYIHDIEDESHHYSRGMENSRFLFVEKRKLFN